MKAGVTLDKAGNAAAAPSLLRRVKDFVGRFLVPMSPVLPSLRNYLLLTPVVFAFRFHSRRLYWRLTGHKLKQLVKGDGVDSNFVAEQVLPYNLGNINIINRGRTERIIAILRSIRGIKLHTLDTLVVGPRNEAELLLLSSYGFDAAKLTAIDLFSYSPAVQLMDMHELKFSDSCFDVVYSAFVITYSDDIPKAIEETIRVAKDGALIVFVFEHLAPGAGNRFGKNNLSEGPRSLLEVFNANVGHVYWNEDFENEGRYTSSVVFRLSKRNTATQ
ncbi:class I SAM-dependent methyltransferase [Bradyrhizobium canariense]|uniref:Methyltransferase domain-containing protein n=1 Tax=Bradyrhizobium canariense TaxID=255045 RepID=A0A1H1M4Q8_9BRAD|nr:methyltransferase domain-containing protein [Bradyrhizobium canariense]SDR81751.1 Methyltransferase domain-containing protein [Bradyrhizobium canariense]